MKRRIDYFCEQNTSISYLFRWLLFLLCLLGFGPMTATIIQVSSLSALQQAINSANPVDNIILANGSYKNSSLITIKQQGSALKPITISAESIGALP